MGSVGENALTLVILLLVFIIGYLKISKKTMKEAIEDIKGD